MTALAVRTSPMPIERTVVSEILGPLAVTAETELHFPRGILGFPECRRFVLLASPHDGLYWLQSTEFSALTFVVADPFRFVPEYAVDLGPSVRHQLEADDATDVAIFAIVTLAAAPAEAPSMNLQGPLLVNLRRRRAVQQVIPESRWGVAVPFSLAAG